MSLAPGTRLGSYEILAPIGAGGMGEVYRARDAKLRREVALKILPDAFARDADRMTRFQREAEVLASLNHPNIATIYEFEDNVLAMELVEGQTLKGPLELAVALRLAHQIAEALEYAHERGIIHRDLKPANVKVTADGVAKVLDFGLAKAIEDPASSGTAPGSAANSPTITLVAATRAGVILGTAAYMSPEGVHDPRILSVEIFIISRPEPHLPARNDRLSPKSVEFELVGPYWPRRERLRRLKEHRLDEARPRI